MSTQTRIEEADVLIVGAGPAGLLAAVALGRYGVKTAIVDRRNFGEVYGHADGIQPGTQEMWHSYGLREKLMQEGRPLIAFGTWITNPETNRIERLSQGPDISTADARFPFEVIITIERMEGILREAAETYGVQVQYGLTPIDIDFGRESKDEYPLKVSLVHGDSVEVKKTIQSKYVIGCDGARSWVRTRTGIQLEVMEKEEEVVTWGVLDFTPKGDFPDTRIKNIISTPVCGMIGWIPRPQGTARIYIPLPPGHSAYTEERLLSSVQEIVSLVVKPYVLEITDCTWISTYTVVQAVATSYSVDNRVFIAGDACHTHSPKAGQGANASMRDTHNLAWKLAYVLRGWAKASLLSTYDDEQRAFARELIALDYDIARAFQLGGNDSKYKRIWNDKNRFLSGIGVLHCSALTPTISPNPCAGKLIPGERAPPSGILRLSDWTPLNVQDLLESDCTFKLLLFIGDITLEDVRTRSEAFVSLLKHRLQMHPGGEEMLKIHTILRNKKSAAHWTDVPERLRDPLAVHVDDILVPTYSERSGLGAYDDYGVCTLGAAVLVRPDAHVSMVVPLNTDGVDMLTSFFDQL